MFCKKVGNNSWEETLATCMGHREGTGCYHRSRSTQKRENWQNWQLCYKCARKLHPEYYKDKNNHGVRPMPTNKKYNIVPFGIVELPKIE